MYKLYIVLGTAELAQKRLTPQLRKLIKYHKHLRNGRMWECEDSEQYEVDSHLHFFDPVSLFLCRKCAKRLVCF